MGAVGEGCGWGCGGGVVWGHVVFLGWFLFNEMFLGFQSLEGLSEKSMKDT